MSIRKDLNLMPCREFLALGIHLFGSENCNEICKSYFKQMSYYQNLKDKSEEEKKTNSKNKKKLSNKSQNYKAKGPIVEQEQRIVNLASKEFVPKDISSMQNNQFYDFNQINENNEDDLYDYEEEFEERIYGPNLEHLENSLMIMAKYKECDCCKGDIYNCIGETCKRLGVCYCFLHDELVDNEGNACI